MAEPHAVEPVPVEKNILIYVTGFGLFNKLTSNASWEAVRLLPTEHRVHGIKCSIKLLEIPVVYEDVDCAVADIWKENPKLVIHCGVHRNADTIRLEEHAYNGSFCSPDSADKCLPCKEVPLNRSKSTCDATTLSTKLNVSQISKELNADVSERCKFTASTEVGTFLCGYIYLKSLDVDENRTLFVHVPQANAPYSSVETSQAILRVLEKCVQQLAEKNQL